LQIWGGGAKKGGLTPTIKLFEVKPYLINANACFPQVTFIEAMPKMMPFFDKQIAQLADRILIRPRKIDSYVNVFASEVTLTHMYIYTYIMSLSLWL